MENTADKINSDCKNIITKNHDVDDLINVYRKHDNRRIGMIDCKELKFIPEQSDGNPINLSYAIICDIKRAMATIFNN